MARKNGRSRPRQWRKIHLGVDEETLEVRAIEFTGTGVGDAPMLPELLNQIPPHEEIASVTADGAYDTRNCHEAISKRGAARMQRLRATALAQVVRSRRATGSSAAPNDITGEAGWRYEPGQKTIQWIAFPAIE